MQNYKVFINNDLIFFEQIAKFESNNASYADYHIIKDTEVLNMVDLVKSSKQSTKSCVLCQDTFKTFSEFCSHFVVLEAAGGLVQNKKKDLLMIHRFDRWDFPKGHVEKNELVNTAAIREVTEETGVKNLTIHQKLPCTYHMYDNKGSLLIKKTHWYLMETCYSEKLVPQLEEDILAAIWVPFYAIEEYMTTSYPALQQMVEYMFEEKILTYI